MPRYITLLIIWILSDFALFIASFVLAYVLRVGPILSTDYPLNQHLIITLAVAPLWLMVMISYRTFALNRPQHSFKNLIYIAYAGVIGTALFALGYFFIYGLFFSRLLLVYAFVLVTMIIFIWHNFFEKIKRHILRAGSPTFPTLIVGLTTESKEFIKLLNKTKHPYKPVAILDARGSKEAFVDGVPFRGKLNKVDEVLNEGISHLVHCHNLEHTINLSQICQKRSISYLILPSVLGGMKIDEGAKIEGKSVAIELPKQRLLWFFT